MACDMAYGERGQEDSALYKEMSRSGRELAGCKIKFKSASKFRKSFYFYKNTYIFAFETK